MSFVHFGITAPGENRKAIEKGWLTMDGGLAMNPSGGLLGGGHPVEATEIRIVLEAYNQLTGKAHSCQMENCSNVATLIEVM
ncbi:MAG: hypothetical protein GY751_23890 [Bacteroidetes bacterium]|nr:hypothetical protein [Bacteroidota bacterium]